MVVIPKPWGFAVPLEAGEGHREDRLFVAPRGFCSLHRHAGASNHLRVEWGSLFVDLADSPDAEMVYPEVQLRPGQEYTVRPGDVHRFRAGPEGAVVYETTWPRDDADIERFSEGGIGR